MKGFVYILQDELGRYYIGSSADVTKRLKRHVGGWVHTTRRMNNPKLVFIQEYPTIAEAKKI